MKKTVQYFYIALLIALVLSPFAVFKIFERQIDTNNYENRTLADFPVPGHTVNTGTIFETEVTIDSFPGLFDSWFNDHLPFRNQLLSLNGMFDYKILKSSASESVIVGKDGWLFYKGAQVNEEDPVADYLGTNLFTEGELAQIANNMLVTRDLLAERGCDFVLFFCPNKERVYSSMMPDAYGEPAEHNRLEQLTNYLRSHTDLTVVNAMEDIEQFRGQHPEQQLYYKYDTHWNDIGAYAGTKSLNEALGFEQIDFAELTVEDYGLGNFDLARLIHLGQYLQHDGAYSLYGFTPHEIRKETDGSGTEYRMFTDYTAPGEKLFVIGDSFSTMSLDYYACHFQEAYLNFYYNYTYEMLEREHPTVVVYECVERYLGTLMNFTLAGGVQIQPGL